MNACQHPAILRPYFPALLDDKLSNNDGLFVLFRKKKNLFRLGELLSRSAHPRVTGVIPPALPKVVGLSLLIPRCAFFLTDVPLVPLPRIFVGKISYLSGSRSPTCLPSGPRSVKFCVFLLVFLNQILALRRITRSQKFSTRHMQ